MAPAASVVLFSDFGPGGKTDWHEMAAVLAELARQDFPEPVEHILVESEERAATIPADVGAALPGLRIVVSPATTSAALKNAGVRAASAEIVGLLPADCLPTRDWVRQMVEALRRRPDAAAVSGRTDYPGGSLALRTFALLERGFLDPGGSGDTWSVSYNNAGYRRAVLLACPFPEVAFACGGKTHAEAIRRAGHPVIFEPAMKVVHHFEGWVLEKDIRRNLGYAAVASRRHEPRIALSWVTRLGYGAIPVLLAARTLYDWGVCLRRAGDYGLRWYETPFALATAAAVRVLEVPGMVHALRGRPLPETAFR